MKKYTANLHKDVILSDVIAWCEKSFGKHTTIPYHDRTNWWDKRAQERSANKKRWDYKFDWGVDYEVIQLNNGIQLNSGIIVYPTSISFKQIEIITKRQFIFSNKDDFTAFKMTWDCE